MAINDPGNLSGNYILMNDIDLGFEETGTLKFAPIGDLYNPFTGTFNGQGNTISNITYPGTGMLTDIGLFSYTENASISNLNLENIGLTGTQLFVGALIGQATNTTIKHCSVVNSAGYDINGDSNVGGLFGIIKNSEISDSYAITDVKGDFYVGGIAGSIMNTSVSDSYATGNVTGNDQVGGFIGHIREASVVSNSYATGDVMKPGSTIVGGFVGYMSVSSSIFNSYATGNAEGASYVGGFAGHIENSEISRSYAEGDSDGIYTGGFIGYMTNSEISNSYAVGDVNGGYVGGFAGVVDAGSSISNSYSIGDATGTWTAGFVGYLYAPTITDSFYIGSPDSGDDSMGFFVTPAELMQIATFTTLENDGGYISASWDMSPSQNRNFIWYIDEGTDYPKINWNYDPQTEQQKGGSGTGSATIVENNQQNNIQQPVTPTEPTTSQPTSETTSSTSTPDSGSSVESSDLNPPASSNPNKTPWALIAIGILIVIGCVGYYLYRKQ